MASEAAIVTMASCAPRMRKAGRATAMPSSAATIDENRIARTNGMSQLIVTFDRVNPAAPAKAVCAREI